MNILNTIKTNLSAQIFLALILGVLTGLFFGEKIVVISFIGDAFIRLFQMPVIPYIMVSLINSLGRLEFTQAKAIFFKGGLVMLGFWGIILAVVSLFPLGFPTWQSASFFSTSLLEPDKPIDLISLFIPANPFEAMATKIIPSIVLFSICLGIALIPLPEKQPVLAVLKGLEQGLLKITQTIAKLTPYGVFAIIANAAGTLTVEAFERLQVYMLLQGAIALMLSFFLLPGLIILLTPIKYGEIFKAFRAPLLTAFATGNLLIVLPLMVNRSRQLLSEIDPDLSSDSPTIASPIDVLVPAAFVFPNMGKLISLSFIPFAAWFGGSSLPITQYPVFLISGLASFFGDGITSMRFLLQLFGMPADMIQLYITLDQVSVARFGTLLAGMNMVALALIGTCLINGWVRWRRPRILRFSIITALMLLLTLGSVRLFFTYVVTNTYTKDQHLAKLELLRVRDAQSTEVFRAAIPPLTINSEQSQLEQIQARGFIRVCYRPDDYPMSYFNQQGQLVGLSIEMMHIFAKTLGVKLQFVPFGQQATNELIESAQKLNSGYCDLIGNPLTFSPGGVRRISYSVPFLKLTASFIVKDKDKTKFATWSNLQQIENLKLGSLETSEYYRAKLEGLLPDAKLIDLTSIRALLDSGELSVDGIIYPAESGAAWTLLYPSYSLAIPKPIISVPSAYAVPKNQPELKEVLDTWLLLKEQDGTLNSLFDYWVQGKTKSVEPPRWSILQNVLGVEF